MIAIYDIIDLLNALRLVLMKFGFDADTLDAVWIFYNNKLSLNPIWFKFAVVYAGSFPIVLNILVVKDSRYLMLVSDLYYTVLGLISTFAALTWTFTRNNTGSNISNQLLIDLSLTRVDRGRFVIGSIGYESFIILYNLLPFSLGFFISRFFIILSGAIGVYTPIELLQSFLWIFVYQVGLFLWLYFLRILWVIVLRFCLNVQLAYFVYASLILLMVFFTFSSKDSIYFLKFYKSLENINYSSGLSSIIYEFANRISRFFETTYSKGFEFYELCFNFILCFIVNLFWLIKLYQSQHKRVIHYVSKISILILLYVLLFQVVYYFDFLIIGLFYTVFSFTFSLIKNIVTIIPTEFLKEINDHLYLLKTSSFEFFLRMFYSTRDFSLNHMLNNYPLLPDSKEMIFLGLSKKIQFYQNYKELIVWGNQLLIIICPLVINFFLNILIVNQFNSKRVKK